MAITPSLGQIERLFGTMKRRYLYRVRYRSLVRSRCCALAALHGHEPAKG